MNNLVPSMVNINRVVFREFLIENMVDDGDDKIPWFLLDLATSSPGDRTSHTLISEYKLGDVCLPVADHITCKLNYVTS